jgi:hypothetical protein
MIGLDRAEIVSVFGVTPSPPSSPGQVVRGAAHWDLP